MDELLRIDPEFESKIPPLTEEEYQLLEENILQDGVVLNPLIVWNGCIVDGHNRFRIIQAHPEIKSTVFKKEFPHAYAAIAWICCNQLGRRNLTPQQKKYLIGQRYEAEKQTASFHGNQHTLADESGGGQNVHHQKVEKTAERIARENNTNERYVRRAERYAMGVDAADEIEPGILLLQLLPKLTRMLALHWLNSCVSQSNYQIKHQPQFKSKYREKLNLHQSLMMKFSQSQSGKKQSILPAP